MAGQIFEGIKVADFTWLFSGPIAARYLADYGASVIHIESSSRFDGCRTSPPYKDRIPGVNRSVHFNSFNCNKYGVTLDLNHPRALNVARKIIAWADVVVENFAPGRMEAWGLDYESLKKVKPDIIMLSASMQGHTGPHARHPSVGYQLTALTGFSDLSGWADRGPTQPYAGYTDMVSCCFVAATVVAALDYKRRTGKGQHIDLSQYESCIHPLAPVVLDYTVNGRVATRTGNRCAHAAPHGAYPCRGEDRWCAIAVFSDEEWGRLRKAMDDPMWAKAPEFSTLSGRKKNEDELDRLMGSWTRGFAAERVMEVVQAAGVAAGVVQDGRDVCNDPQLEHRGHFLTFDHPEVGPYKTDAYAFRLSKVPADRRMAAPLLGEHNEYVYTQILKMPADEYDELLVAGVFE